MGAVVKHSPHVRILDDTNDSFVANPAGLMPDRRSVFSRLGLERVAWIIMAISPMLTLTTSESVAQKGSISGVLLDATTEIPIDGAPVYLLGTPSVAISKDGGIFTFDQLEPGPYLVSAIQYGYTQVTDSVHVDADMVRVHTLRLVPEYDDPTRLQNRGALTPSDDAARSYLSVRRNREYASTCDCHQRGVAVLDSAIDVRTRFPRNKDFLTDSSSVAIADSLRQEWHLLQLECFSQFGAQLFQESSCSSAALVNEKRKLLNTLGLVF